MSFPQSWNCCFEAIVEKKIKKNGVISSVLEMLLEAIVEKNGVISSVLELLL